MAIFFGASNFKMLCYTHSNTTCAMMVWFLIKCCVFIECICGDREIRRELWCAMVRNLSYYTHCEQDETVSCNHECLLSTLLPHLHSNCLGTHICFVSSSSNKLPHFISATNLKIMLWWDEFMRFLHARLSVRYACSFV